MGKECQRHDRRDGGKSAAWRLIIMGPLLLVLLLALILFGAGFALKILWWIAVVVLVLWLLGFVMRGTHSSGRRHRWYRW
jgi:small-conductance mechanosensitive channel